MSSLPNLRHVRLFLACAERGSLTGAAMAMGITQPAASQALKRLERIMGAALIEREAMAPTTEGRMALRRFQRMIDFIGQARRHVSQGPEFAQRLTWPHLRAISAFADHGSFSAAARMLGLSEPAVQQIARDAELVMDTRLFEAAGRAVRLTDAGHASARWFRLALAEFDNAVDEIMETRGRYAGRVCIGTLPLTRTFLVPEAVAALAKRHPLARFEILEGSYESLLADLERGRIDLLVGALRGGTVSKALRQEPLFDFELRVVGRADHPLREQPTELGPSDLARFPWIVARRGTPSRNTFAALAATFPPDQPARESVETGSLNVIRGVLLKSDHLALLSLHQIRYELEAGFLAALEFEPPHSRRTVGMTFRRDWFPTALQSEFLAALRESPQASCSRSGSR